MQFLKTRKAHDIVRFGREIGLRTHSRRYAALLAAAAVGVAWASPARADTYDWSSFGISLFGTNTPPVGGSGTWDLSGNNWLDTNGASPWQSWPNTDNAVADFGVAPGVVTLGAAGIQANGLEFDVDGYTLAGGSGDALSLAGNNTFINVASGATATITAALTNASLFNSTSFSGGTLILGGAADNAYLNLAVNGGTVVLNKASTAGVHAIGTGLTINSGLVQLSGTGGDQIYDGDTVNVNGGTFDLNGKSETIGNLNLGGSTAVTPTVVLNGGTLTLGGNLNYNGGSTSPSVTGGLPGRIIAGSTSGGSLHLAGTNPTISVTGFSNATSDLQIDVPITASNGITFSGFSNGGLTSQIELAAVSTYSGPTTVQGTFLFNSVVNALPTGTALNLAAVDSFLLLGANQTVGSLSGVAGSFVELNGGILTAGGDNSDSTFSGNFTYQGTNGLSKVGTGTQTLSGGGSAMNFLAVHSGGVVVDGGILTLNSVGQTGFGTTSSLFLEGTGGATMTVKDGAKLITTDSPQLHNGATITVDGTGTSWTNANSPTGVANTIRIGFAGANGGLTVQNNASVTANNNLQIGDLGLLSNPGSAIVAVNSGGSLSVAKRLFVDAGSTLSVNGGTVSAGDLVSGAVRTINSVVYPEAFLNLGPTQVPVITVGSDNTSSTFNGTIWGWGEMTKVGTGTLTLGGTSDNISFGLDVNGGKVVLAKTSSPSVHALAWANVDSGTLQLAGTGGDQIWDRGTVGINAGALDLNGNSETFNNLSFGDSPTVVPTASLKGGNLSLYGDISYNGGTTGKGGLISQDVPAAGTLNLLGTNCNISVTGGTDFAGLTINTPIVGASGITKTGGGILLLGGTNTYTGPTVVNGGGIVVSNSNALQNSVVTVNVDGGLGSIVSQVNVNGLAGPGAILFGSAGLTLNGGSAAPYSGLFTSTANIGMLSFSGTPETFTGGTFDNPSTAANLDVEAGHFVLDGGALSVNASGSTGFGGTSSVFISGWSGSSLTVQNGASLLSSGFPQLHNAATMTVTGPGTLWSNADPAGSAGQIRIGYAGGTSTLNVQNQATVWAHSHMLIGDAGFSSNAGIAVVNVSNGANLNVGGQLYIDYGSALHIRGGTVNVGQLFGFTGPFTNGGGQTFASPVITASNPAGGVALTIGSDNSFSVFGGTIADDRLGPGGIEKVGTGEFELLGANTYTGGTTINGGTLYVSNDQNLGGAAGNVNLGPGATLLYGNSDTTARTFNSNAGTLQTWGTLTLSGATVNGGFLLGNFVSSFTQISGATAASNTSINQTGPTNVTNFTNGGHFINATNLNWWGGTNAASGTFDVNSFVSISGFTNAGVMNVNGSLSDSGANLTFAAGSRTYINSGGSMFAFGGPMQLNGALLDNNGSISGDVHVNFGSLLEGTGSGGNIFIGKGGIVHPGNSPGALSSSSATWQPGGELQIDFANATGTPGADWSVWNISGPLSITATAADHFIIDVAGLEQLGAGGATPIFDPSENYSWTLATSTGITGFSPADFTLNFDGFNTPVNGSFTLVSDGKDIALDYNASAAAVPEPTSLAGIGLACGALLLRRRRRT